MASRVVTRVAGAGLRLVGSLFKGAGSLVQNAGRAAPRRKRGHDDSETRARREARPDD